MPRLALFNLLVGFVVLFLAAAAGAFLATTITDGFVHDRVILESWAHLLQRSAHGHSNLFGVLHICLGLTMPYALLSNRIRLLQTIGLCMGTLAMGPLMLWRASLPPTNEYDASGIIIGICLSAALLALGMQIFGLGLKLIRRV